MTERLRALRRRLLKLQRAEQLCQKFPRSLALISKQCPIPSQDVTNQCVEVSILAKSEAEYVENFTGQSHYPSIADTEQIGLQQRPPLGTVFDATPQPFKRFGYLRKRLAKSETDYVDTILKDEIQGIGSKRGVQVFHRYLTLILPDAVNISKNKLVDNKYHQRDIKCVTMEIRL